MRKSILLSLAALAIVQSLSAQNFYTDRTSEKRAWFDFQLVQHVGLNPWSAPDYVNDGFPGSSLTEFRGVLNIYMVNRYAGGFIDMGVGILSASGMRSFDLDRMPLPNRGSRYYLREMLSQTGSGRATAQFKMATGFFGDIPAGEKWSVMPYLGIGFLTMPQRKFEMILKEDGSNMQYRATYLWNGSSVDDYASSLGYLTGRLNVRYAFSPRSSLLLGLEYMWCFNALDFYCAFSNTFNANIERRFIVEGNRMNMLGVSVGISF